MFDVCVVVCVWFLVEKWRDGDLISVSFLNGENVEFGVFVYYVIVS